ncbi:MAG: sugar transferase [Caldilinea sp. CFX5]|nr:sugar transferase [Caldilinea sp. CFX5]
MPTGFVGFNVELHRRPFLPPADQPIADNPDMPPTSTWLNDQQSLPPVDHAFRYFVKRLLDWLIILLALGFLFPLILLIGIAIKLDSPGPIVMAQERIGRRRRRRQGKVTWEQAPFPLYQFRTTAADHSPTPVGRVLRRTCLDQLPQLWNIIKGDLTLVGPRPLSPPMPLWDPPEVAQRLETIPGMFDTTYIRYKRS